MADVYTPPVPRRTTGAVLDLLALTAAGHAQYFKPTQPAWLFMDGPHLWDGQDDAIRASDCGAKYHDNYPRVIF